VLGDGIVVKEEVGICEVGLGKVDSTRVVESTFGVLEVSVLADDVDMVLELSTGYVSVVVLNQALFQLWLMMIYYRLIVLLPS